ncbi:MAG: hypothetical protein JO189_27685 [Deltaproteobacteria bacterium]|nr:hypothetical protein [Deltaproteobacteria bacterium]
MTTSSSGGSFYSLDRGGFGGPSGINASGFDRGFARLRARHRSFEQNQFPHFPVPGLEVHRGAASLALLSPLDGE